MKKEKKTLPSRDLKIKCQDETVINLSSKMNKLIKGKEDVVTKIIVALLSGGHVLLEDVPGVGKTTLAKALADGLKMVFGRIQFTPDTLPSDVTGASIYNMHTGSFEVMVGPVMKNILLADEINRTSPKTQASLLEVMEENQVTIDGKSYPVPKPFMVIATENPVNSSGTYELPEAELDRFMMKLSMGYPDKDSEIKMIQTYISNVGDKAMDKIGMENQPLSDENQNVDSVALFACMEKVNQVSIHEDLAEYVVRIAENTRNSADLDLGVSPRGVLTLLRAAKAAAYISGRDFVLPDDIKALGVSILAHRVKISMEAAQKGMDAQDVIQEIIRDTAIPAILGK